LFNIPNNPSLVVLTFIKDCDQCIKIGGKSEPKYKTTKGIWRKCYKFMISGEIKQDDKEIISGEANVDQEIVMVLERESQILLIIKDYIKELRISVRLEPIYNIIKRIRIISQKEFQWYQKGILFNSNTATSKYEGQKENEDPMLNKTSAGGTTGKKISSSPDNKFGTHDLDVEENVLKMQVTVENQMGWNAEQEMKIQKLNVVIADDLLLGDQFYKKYKKYLREIRGNILLIMMDWVFMF
jgi:hypothetical protein